MESATHAKDQDAGTKVAGEQRSTKSTILETGAAMTQAGSNYPHLYRVRILISPGLFTPPKYLRPPQRLPRLRVRPKPRRRG